MTYEGPKYTKVRNDFLERRDLSITEKLILVYLYGRQRRDGQPWEVNSEQIRMALNLGHGSTDKALSRLKAGGWLTDNRKAVRGSDGRVGRAKSTVIESRCPDVVASDVSPGHTESRKPWDGKPWDGNRDSNKGLSDEGQSNEVFTADACAAGYNRCAKHGLYALSLRACPSCPLDYNPNLQRLKLLASDRSG